MPWAIWGREEERERDGVRVREKKGWDQGERNEGEGSREGIKHVKEVGVGDKTRDKRWEGERKER